jgi:heme exporter protein B
VFTFSSLLLLALATATLKELKAFSETLFYQGLDLTKSPGGVHADAVIGQAVEHALFPAWSGASKLALLWVLLCFAAFAGLSHSFVHEEETGTTTALRLTMSPPAVYTGKLLFNLLLISAVALVVTPVYMMITGMGAGSPGVFIATMMSGCIGLAGAATIVAALAAKAQGTGALYGAIGLPLLVVFLILLLNAANTVYAVKVEPMQIVKDVGGLLSYGVALIAISALTFHFVWEE